MAAIFPSDVVSVLLKYYPWVRGLSHVPTFYDPANDGSKVAALVALVDQIEPSLLPQPRDEYVKYTETIASLRQVLKDGERGGSIHWPSVHNNNLLTTLWLNTAEVPG